jgi:hypothetical protein
MKDPRHLRRSVTMSCGVQCAGFALLAWLGSADLPVELFALALFTALVARAVWGARYMAHVPHPVVGFGRRTARGVYLLMYVLVGIELVRALATFTPPHTERCLPYLGCVVAAQLLIRSMTAVMSVPGVNETPRRTSANRAVRSVTKRS